MPNKSHPRRQSMMCVGLLVSSLLLAVQPSGAQDAADPILVGVSLGRASSFGQQLERGLELGIAEVNAKNGALGHPLKLVVYDDQDKPEQTTAIFERLITRDKASILVGPLLTASTAASLNITKRYGKVQIAPGAKAGKLRDQGHDKAFFLNTPVEMDGAKFDQYVAQTLKPKNVVILAEASEYGLGVVKSIQSDWAAPDSPHVVSVENIQPGDTDFSPILTKIKGLNPDAIYVASGNLETTAAVLRQMDQLGIKATRLMAAGSVSSGLIKLAGKASEGLLFGDFYSNQEDTPENKKFVADFQTKFGYTPDKLELTGYESIAIAAAAINKANATDDDIVAKALIDSTFDTPRGDWKFVKMGQSWQAPGGSVLLTIKNGVITRFEQ